MSSTVLVVAPTRELATQIQVEAVKFGRLSRISCMVNIGNVNELVANKAITQVLAHIEKKRPLEQILRSQEHGSRIIIFCSNKKMCDQLARNLNRNFGAAAIHGDKSQSERDSVLGQFKMGRSPILVATDVAARGLDIKDVRAVINYDFPTGVEDYVHQIGRTGRAGATGVAYTFFGDQDAKYASDLIKILEGANQKVPAEVRSMATRGGGGSKFHRWGSSSNRGCSRGDLGFGGRAGWSAPYGGRTEKGRGRGYGNDSRYKYHIIKYGDIDGYEKGLSRSPSPIATRGTGFGGRSRSWSRSQDRFDRNRPVGSSFHQQ
ncbi:hypothetical protein SAY86_026224 [Trapa natans]|uniref:RNA helicase n=1 Tax=Trapa natans TaxID=22666 RepID=A0AAN7KHJ8_TRANT|nr:hypothetical protein SAY86_026224 [Trapa natans]